MQKSQDIVEKSPYKLLDIIQPDMHKDVQSTSKYLKKKSRRWILMSGQYKILGKNCLDLYGYVVENEKMNINRTFSLLIDSCTF